MQVKFDSWKLPAARSRRRFPWLQVLAAIILLHRIDIVWGMIWAIFGVLSLCMKSRLKEVGSLRIYYVG